MNTEQPRYENVLHDEFFKAAAATGLPANPDFNDWSHPQVLKCYNLFTEKG